MKSANNPIKINSLMEELSHISQKRKILPLHLWSPKSTTPFDITIKDNGEWWHNGTKMTRQSLVDLFASVLWGEYDAQGVKHYYLRTPSDQYQICVMDAPLFICDVDKVVVDGVAWLLFTTTNQDQFYLSDDNPLYIKTYLKDGKLEERFYVDTRFNLTACVLPSALYRLVALGELDTMADKVVLSLSSGGKIYQLQSDVHGWDL